MSLSRLGAFRPQTRLPIHRKAAPLISRRAVPPHLTHKPPAWDRDSRFIPASSRILSLQHTRIRTSGSIPDREHIRRRAAIIRAVRVSLCPVHILRRPCPERIRPCPAVLTPRSPCSKRLLCIIRYRRQL